jgi:IclR family acetate operon transcriptional repressor
VETKTSEVEGAIAGGSRSIQRALEVLERVVLEPRELRLSELAALTKLPVSSVHRILANLEARGLVELDSDTHRYGVGLRMLMLASRVTLRRDAAATVPAAMREMFVEAVREIDETGYLAVLNRSEVVYVECLESSHPLRAVAPVGSRRSIHSTAVGKVLVADLTEAERAVLLGDQPLAALTPFTITDRATLEVNLQMVRAQGYAIDVGEFAEDLVCLGFPIRDAAGATIAAVGVTGPSTRMTGGRLEACVARLQRLVDELSRLSIREEIG